MGTVNITGASPSIKNPLNLGIAATGSSSNGAIWQYNNNRNDVVNIGASQDGSLKEVIAADPGDTFHLTGGWKDGGSAVDANSKISGHLFTDQKGDQVLISGNAQLTGDFTGTSDDPTKSTAPAPVISKALSTTQINKAPPAGVKTTPGTFTLGKASVSSKNAPSTFNLSQSPSISNKNLTQDISLMKADPQNTSIEQQKPTPDCVTQQEIQNSITDEVLPDADKSFWRNIATNFNLIDASGKGGTKNDGLINISDIKGSGYATVT